MDYQVAQSMDELGTTCPSATLQDQDKGGQPSSENEIYGFNGTDLPLTVLLKRLRSMNLYSSELALKNHETEARTNNELLTHYLVVLRRYIDFLMGKNNYASERFRILWNDSLLRRMSIEHMMIVHWYFLKHVPEDIEIVPDLVVAFLTHPDLIPARYRLKYYAHYYHQVSQRVPMSPDDPRPHYRAYAKGPFHDNWCAEQRLPEDLLEIIEEDCDDAVNIMLTLMGETWSARIFSEALDRKALKIIQHFVQMLTPDDEEFSAYDCIIHILLNAHDHDFDCQFAISILKSFEAQHPGILKNYHDDYGNNLLKFLGEGRSSFGGLRENIDDVRKNHPELLDYLIEAGCDPDEKNTLFLSFNDFAR